jgi:hypothetical protein
MKQILARSILRESATIFTLALVIAPVIERGLSAAERHSVAGDAVSVVGVRTGGGMDVGGPKRSADFQTHGAEKTTL